MERSFTKCMGMIFGLRFNSLEYQKIDNEKKIKLKYPWITVLHSKLASGNDLQQANETEGDKPLALQHIGGALVLIESCGRLLHLQASQRVVRNVTPHVASSGLHILIFSTKEVNPCCFSNLKSFTFPLQQHVFVLGKHSMSCCKSGSEF